MKIAVDNARIKVPINAIYACKTATPQLGAVNPNQLKLQWIMVKARAKVRVRAAGARNRAGAEVDKLHKAMIPCLTRLT